MDQVGEAGAAGCPFCHNGIDRRCVLIEDEALVAIAHQSADNVAAHASEANHSDFHLPSPSRRAVLQARPLSAAKSDIGQASLHNPDSKFHRRCLDVNRRTMFITTADGAVVVVQAGAKLVEDWVQGFGRTVRSE
jgi:hypothetical protein